MNSVIKLLRVAFVCMILGGVGNTLVFADQYTETSTVFECPFEPCEKTYVDQSQVHIIDNQIWIEFEEGCLKTSALYADRGGVFFQDASECRRDERLCPGCYRCIKFWYTLCPNCKALNRP